ncbi:restriction endonuclease subunit S [Phocaeicola massiliensis]|uniref:restriction endonuclease subunit S n=2 Tax=Phocaeicola massiliensis TaxID=204516 RepID=UPI0034A26DEE
MAENKDKKVLNVPALRFPEFTDKWKKGYFKDVCKITTGNKNTQDKDENGLYPFYVRSQNIERINSWTFDGEAILTAGDGVGVGKVFHYSIGKIGVHQRVYILSDFKCDGKYLYQYFSSRFYNRVKRMSAKNSVDSVRMEMIADMPLYLPSVGEQHKIGKLLALLDERISTQNKIIDKFQSLIKGLAVALTTKGKPNTAISQCLECHSSALQESEVMPNGLYKVFGANGLVGYTDVPQMNGDAILVIKDGSGVGTVSYAQGKFSVIGTLNYLTVIGNNDLRYLYFALSVFNFQPYKTGMAIPHIYFKDYGKAKIYCPSLAEQKRVANVLDKLESKLFVEQELLALFNQQKQYLLRKMFI